jgi:hypothetical protein
MATIPELNMDSHYFLDRSTILFGESGTGKSFLITDILFQLKPFVEQIIVFSPTDRSNHTYDRGIVPLPCIHYTISAQVLEDLWERQEMITSVYTIANKPETLDKLFKRIPNRSLESAAINAVNAKLAEFKKSTDDSAKVTEMATKCGKLVSMIMRRAIKTNATALLKMQLSDDEKFSLKYFNLNPRMVVIFDDCTDLLNRIKKHPVIQKFFYQGRHASLTIIIACHTDKALDPELKKNAFVSIFTEERCAVTYFDRCSNNYDKEARAIAKNACKQAFTPLAKHQKLAWVREDRMFYRLTAELHNNFKFGSPHVWEYCNKIKTDGNNLLANNKFVDSFR